jgi:hypothetical protein
MKHHPTFQQACYLTLLLGAMIYPSTALTVEESISHPSKPILIAQTQVSTSWEGNRFSVEKTTVHNDKIEWIVKDTCQGLTCLSPLVHAKFQDVDGITIGTATVFFEGTNPYRATAKIPSSVSWSKVNKVVVADGPG